MQKKRGYMLIHQAVNRGKILLYRFLNQAKIRKKEKVFVVGFNKSASTSLHFLFQSLTLPSYHGVKWRNHDDLAFLRKYDCFSDGIPRNLAELDRLFPDSKFILNVRGLKNWIYSRLAHIVREKNASKNCKTEPTWDITVEAVKTWIQERNNYHLFVLSYFSDRPGDLLVVNFIRDESAATKVCRFLGYKGEYKRPRKNVNPNKEHPQKHAEILRNCISELGLTEQELNYDIYCPSLESKETREQFPPDSNLLQDV